MIPEKEKCFVKFYVNVFIDWICFQGNLADSGALVFLFTPPRGGFRGGRPQRPPPPLKKKRERERERRRRRGERKQGGNDTFNKRKNVC